ncbi:BMP family ABC transporter substrate-binding protein [Caenimonas aquaedulcis]|uniref:BMP family ABC transporter substrate-binding protein n=1 Tax=Caenimonas aquaedulcis TaxID=2793270 RepID=A0A931H4C9_9BURK|nr:BMP family ABC transporter substrate-binding protein [Caenimonas aquaedulcis]MBG9388272.1 BMP family ABC transporter substrate-binding protein [Caenimonas aquaedulcis]
MIDSKKRSMLKLAALTAMAAAALAGCSKTEAPAPAPAAPAPVASAAAPAPKPEPLKIAFAYVGPVGDGGWTFAHDNGRKAIEKEFGDKIVTSFVEKVPESADAERVLRDMVSQGNKLIFGTTFGYMEPMLKVAADSKDVKFEHATGYKNAPNMRAYDSRTYEGAYMAGVIAGKMTKTNTLGVVGSIPIPEVIRNINSFTLGAQSMNPKVKVKVVWVNEWFSPPKETEAATSLINGGADVLMQNTDSSAVLQTAEKMGKRAFGWDSDMTAYGPKAHLGSAAINWAPYYIKATRDALEGKWATSAEKTWWGVKEGAIDMVSIAADVPEDAKKKVDEVRAGLKDGSFSIWKGPIMGQDGKPIKDAEGKEWTGSDAQLGGINFYVKGVEGKVPGGDKK